MSLNSSIFSMFLFSLIFIFIIFFHIINTTCSRCWLPLTCSFLFHFTRFYLLCLNSFRVLEKLKSLNMLRVVYIGCDDAIIVDDCVCRKNEFCAMTFRFSRRLIMNILLCCFLGWRVFVIVFIMKCRLWMGFVCV